MLTFIRTPCITYLCSFFRGYIHCIHCLFFLVAVCGGELFVDHEARLESPNYPEEYQPSKECIWRITVPENHQVALRFHAFDVENHDSCVYDYVEVRDGLANDSPILNVFCGLKIPADVTSSSNKMLVKFVSDSSVQKGGFSATVLKEYDECLKTDHGCAQQCTNTLGSYKCTCKIGYELHSDGKKCEGKSFLLNNIFFNILL